MSPELNKICNVKTMSNANPKLQLGVSQTAKLSTPPSISSTLAATGKEPLRITQLLHCGKAHGPVQAQVSNFKG
jgi:hypothetical protein